MANCKDVFAKQKALKAKYGYANPDCTLKRKCGTWENYIDGILLHEKIEDICGGCKWRKG